MGNNTKKTAKNNVFPINMIEKLKKTNTPKVKIKNKEPTNHKLIQFTYFNPAVRKITNLFKDTNIKIAFRSTNTTYKQLAKKP